MSKSLTITAESRIDPVSLAAIGKFYRIKGLEVNTMSGLIAQAILDLAGILESNGLAERNMTPKDAAAYIHNNFRLQRRTRRSISNIVSQVQMPEEIEHKRDEAMDILSKLKDERAK